MRDPEVNAQAMLLCDEGQEAIGRIHSLLPSLPATYVELLYRCILEDCIRMAMAEDDIQPCSLSVEERELIEDYRQLPHRDYRRAVSGSLREFATSFSGPCYDTQDWRGDDHD